MEPNTSPPIHVDPVTAAGEVSLRFDRWFAEHHLDLPAETRAQFVEMGMEALQRWPGRSTGDVLDELLGELDARLGRIVDETAAQHDGAASPPEAAASRGADGARPGSRAPGPLARLFGRRDRRH